MYGNYYVDEEANNVNVYVRTYKKYAVILPIRSVTSGKQLREKVKNKYLHKIKDFELFFKGKLISDNDELLKLQQRSIIHLVDLGRVSLPSLDLIFKYHKDPAEIIEITVTPQTVIRDILREIIKPAIGKGETDVFLVYLGKPINIFKKLQEEFVEDGSEIVIV